MITTLLAAVALTPQSDPPPDGSLANRPLVITHVEQANDRSPLYKIGEGPDQVDPELYGNLIPRFQFSKLFESQLSVPTIHFGGFSVGTSNIVSDVTGNAIFSETQWGFLTYSVKPGTVGLSGSIYGEETNGVAGDVLTVYLPGSEAGGIPLEEVGVVQKARDGTAIGVTDIVGIDQFLNALTMAANISVPADERVQSFYFTVPPSDLQYASADWFGGSAQKSSATILELEWNPGTEEWSAPSVFLKWDELGLPREDEITGLAVDEDGFKILVATAHKDRRLWIAIFNDDWNVPGYRGNYMASAGGEFAETVLELGEFDVIDAICANDPGRGEHTELPGIILRKTIGRLGVIRGRDLGLNIAVCRRSGIGAKDEILVFLNGGPVPSARTGTSVAALYLGNTQLAVFTHRNNGYFSTRHIVNVPTSPVEGEYVFRWVVTYRRRVYLSHSATILRKGPLRE